MKSAVVVLLIAMSSLAESGCNTWYLVNKDGDCECGSDLSGRLKCNDCAPNKTVAITAGFCMTYDTTGLYARGENSSSLLIAGDCPYGTFSNTTSRKFTTLPTDPTQVNSSQCSPYNRRGLFCGECLVGFGPAAHSFDLHCSNCSHMSTATAISLYLVLELLPITVFFFVVLAFRPSLMTGPQLGYVVSCQGIINTLQYSRYIYNSLFHYLPPPLAVFGHISLVFSGIWNLEFFRFVTPPFCVSEKMNGIHVQMLGFNTVLFPLLLVSVTYAVVEFTAWYKIVPRFVSAYNFRHSIIHAFATFTMLSIFSTMCQAYAILQTTSVFDITGKMKGSVLQLDPSIRMYSRDHIPYLAISLLLVFILVAIPGILITMYPTRLYGKLSSKCLSTRKQLAVKIFVETVNCGFKDGLNGTRDYRMIPGIMILLALAYSLLMAALPHHGFDGTPPLTAGGILALSGFLVSYLRPCKDLPTNISLSFNLLLIGVFSFLTVLWWQDMLLNSELLASWVVALSLIPHTLMLLWVLYRVLQRFKCLSRSVEAVQRQPLVQRLLSLTSGRVYALQQTEDESFDDEEETQPLLY